MEVDSQQASEALPPGSQTVTTGNRGVAHKVSLSESQDDEAVGADGGGGTDDDGFAGRPDDDDERYTTMQYGAPTSSKNPFRAPFFGRGGGSHAAGADDDGAVHGAENLTDTEKSDETESPDEVS